MIVKTQDNRYVTRSQEIDGLWKAAFLYVVKTGIQVKGARKYLKEDIISKSEMNYYILVYVNTLLPEKAMATHSSTLSWKIPWMEEPGRPQPIGSLSWAWLSDFIFTFHLPASEKEMGTHSSVLVWRIPGMVEPGGLPSMGSHRVEHDWSDLAMFFHVQF